MKTKVVMVPKVHAAGTEKDILIARTLYAIESLKESVTKMRDASPAEKDFSLLGDDAFPKAVNQYYWRLQKVKEVLAEMESIMQGIIDQEQP